MERDPDDDTSSPGVAERWRRGLGSVRSGLRGSFTVRYIIALTLIGSLSLGIGLSALQRISVHGPDAAVINVAGRQRMLSQRIALLAGMYDRAVEDGRAVDSDRLGSLLTAAALDLRTAQADLLTGNPERNLPGEPSADVLAHYADGVERDVDLHADDAMALLDATGPTERAALVGRIEERAIGELLPELNAIVDEYQDEADDRTARMLEIEQAVVAAMMIVLVLEGLLVFRPMSRRIRRETEELTAAAALHEEEASRQAFGLRLRDAVDLADTELDVIDVVGQAVSAGETRHGVDLLLVDTTDESRLVPVLARTDQTCSVRAADDCPALRRRRTMTVQGPFELGGCSHLRHDASRAGREDLACSCVPMAFLGGGIGVLRAVAERGDQINDNDVWQYEHIARSTGIHLGTLRAFDQTKAAAERDPLTHLLNRRGLAAEVDQLAREHRSHLVLALDLDHFKWINDEHGHTVGDAVLVAAAEALTNVCRPGDLIARTGGEEFTVVALCDPDPTVAREQGRGIAERLRAAMAVQANDASVPGCTVSIGVAGPTVTDFDGMHLRADAALYRAKEKGRNRVELDDGAPVVPWQPGTAAARPSPEPSGTIIVEA